MCVKGHICISSLCFSIQNIKSKTHLSKSVSPVKRCISKEDRFEYERLIFTFLKFLHSLAMLFRYSSNISSVRPLKVSCSIMLFCPVNIIFATVAPYLEKMYKDFFQNFENIFLPICLFFFLRPI